MPSRLERKAKLHFVHKTSAVELYTRTAKHAWQQVCQLPKEVLQQFGYIPDARRSGVGFEVKTNGSSYDHKLDMHVTLESLPALVAMADVVDTSGTFRSFIACAENLLVALKPLGINYAKRVEGWLGLRSLVDEVSASHKTWMLRFLYYPPGLPAGDILAQAHTDKGGYTIHILDEHGSLEFLESTNPSVWKSMQEMKNQAIVIPGIGLQDLTDSSLRAVAHKVTATEDSFLQGRIAAVCFVDFLSRRHFDKATYGSQQQQPVGWNYDSTPEEFSRYFID